VHPYLITATPNRWQRAVRTTRTAAVNGSAFAAHLALGLAVLILRTARVVVTICATLAAWLELYLAQRTGKPPLGQIAGMGIATAFNDEFARQRAAYATTSEGTAL
jgi:hypothetical protein